MSVKASEANKQKENIKDVLNESKDMVGEKGLKEGVFNTIFRGYVPLNLLSDLKLQPESAQEERIVAYCKLVKLALRRSLSSLDYTLKGYGADPDDLESKEFLKEDYAKGKKHIDELEAELQQAFQNPSPALKQWFNELEISKETLSPALVNPFQIDQDAYVPSTVLKRMSDVGLFRLKVPTKYGGLGFNQKEYDYVLQTMGKISGTLLGVVSAHNTIGSAPLIMYGSEEQKEKYLTEVSKGDFLVAFGLTEPTSGTDAVGKMKCTAKLSEDGKHWLVNGEKFYITNIHRSGLMYLMAKTDHGDGSPVERMKPTVFIVELPFRISDTQDEMNTKRLSLKERGMKLSKPLDLMMIRGSNQAYIRFENFKVPVDSVLCGVDQGAQVLFNGLNKGRAGFGASYAEASRHIYEVAVRHAESREMFKAFGGKQSDLPQVKRYIAEMASEVEYVKAVSDMTTAFIQEHSHDTNIISECAAIKVLATESSWIVSNYALRLWGGTGTMRGHHGTMELALRDAWIGIVVEGVNEAMMQLVTGVAVQGVKNDADTITRHMMWFLKPFMPKKPEKEGKKKKEFKFDLFGALIPAKLRLAGGLLKFEQGKLDFSDAWWIQWHAKILSFRTALLGIQYGNKMVMKQLELIRMSLIAMDLYSLAAVHLKLKDKNANLSKAQIAALNRYIVKTRKKIQINLSELQVKNPEDYKDMDVADLCVKELLARD